MRNIDINFLFDTKKACLIGSIIIGTVVTAKIVTTLYKHVIYSIEIPLKRNLNLTPKIQTHVKEHSYFGKKTILENGKRTVKTGWMITFTPAIAIFNIKLQKKINEDNDLQDDKTTIYLISNTYDDQSYVKYLRSLSNKDKMIKVLTLSNEKEGPNWHLCNTITRSPQPDYYPDLVIDTIHNEVDIFLQSRDKYIEKGENYKKSFLFYGPTGSGKTSMVKHLGIKYGRDIHTINPEEFFNGNSYIYSALKSCEGGIILMEDIDKFFKSLIDKDQYVNISKLLTTLDGLYTPDDVIIVMTADYTGDLPKQLTRDGRLDCTIRFPYITERSIDVIKKVCDNYFVDQDKIVIKGDITMSRLIKDVKDMSQYAISECSAPHEISEISNLIARKESSGSFSDFDM